MSTSKNIQLEIDALNSQIRQSENTIQGLQNKAHQELKSIVSQGYSNITNELKGICSKASEDVASESHQPMLWGDNFWSDYKPITTLTKETLPNKLLAGYWTGSENSSEGTADYENSDGEDFLVPAYIPFFGQHKSVIIVVNNKFKAEGTSLLRTIVQRIHTLIPHYSQFTLLDPETNGAAFPMQRDICTRKSDADIYHVLENVVNDMKRINSISALTEGEYFSSKVESVTMNEKYEFVCAANFPKGYETRSIERLINIGNIGYVSGRYLFLVYNKDEQMPRDMSIESFKDATILDLTTYDKYNRLYEHDRNVEYATNIEADSNEWKSICEILEQCKPQERKITWEDYIAVNKDNIWKHSSKELLETSIGDCGGKSLNIWFGKKDNSNCAHGMLAATTGAGKSNFYHALILGLAVRYSPNELRMYLIDGKNGVEFEVYRSFPHAEVVSLKSSPELTGSVIEELVKEVERRNELFKLHNVNSYDEYRKFDDKVLPRILLVIDEYQVLFEGKNSSQTSEALSKLTSQARSAGVHMILGSQRFSVPNMQNKDSIFGNIQLRVAMKMTQDDRISLTEFGKEGKEFISACDLPGQIVVNQNSGSDGNNHLGKVAYIEGHEKCSIIEDITNLAKEHKIADRIMSTIVFEGDSAPNLDENPELMFLAKNYRKMSPMDIQQVARTPEYAGGFGKSEWNISENPMIAWIGQEFNVYSQAAIMFRRRKMENALIVGDRNASRYGMLVSTLFSLAANAKPNDIQFRIYDRSLIGTDWNPYLKRICEETLSPAGYNVKFANKIKDITEGIYELQEELKSRLTLDQDERQDLKPIYLFVTEPEDIEVLNQEIDHNGFKKDTPLGFALRELYVNGSQTGIHVILSSSGVVSLSSVLAKKDLMYFRHRVALQISEQESFDYLQSRNGSMLQTHGDVPTVAYYADINGNAKFKFKPYSIKDECFETQFINVSMAIIQ